MKRNWKGISILIVEDDLSLLEVLNDFFESTGANVFQADNGQKALFYCDEWNRTP
jgi:DNA-binding response OmpR family regulator